MPWFVAVLVGGGLGYVFAVVMRRAYTRRPRLRRASTLLPWRTLAVTLTLIVLSPLIPVFMGLGTAAGATLVALFVLVWALPSTAGAVLDHWYPASLTGRLIGAFRTLATATVAIVILTPAVAGSGGAGRLIFQEGWQVLDYPQVVRGFLVVVLLALVIDLLLGGLQLLLPRPSKRFGRGSLRSGNHASRVPPKDKNRAASGYA